MTLEERVRELEMRIKLIEDIGRMDGLSPPSAVNPHIMTHHGLDKAARDAWKNRERLGFHDKGLEHLEKRCARLERALLKLASDSAVHELLD